MWLYPVGIAVQPAVSESRTELYGSIIPRDSQPAEGAAFDKIKTSLQNYLFVGLKRSDKRRQERSGNITFSVNLYLPKSEGHDFFLEMWVCSELGQQLSEASIGPLEDMADMLGGWVYAGLETSRVALERRNGFLEATNILQACRDGNDFKILVPMGFAEGHKLYEHLYLSVVNPAPAAI